ncbi:MAG: hypothetical protein KBH55_01175 [Faecalibacterium sp.]|nr:hypothetical protein [Faecalibacterium sp.]
MMMPANFSAISENEMTYVNGGASLSEILAPELKLENWQKFNQNMVTIIGNSFLGDYVSNTVGTLFGGAYKPGNLGKAWFSAVSKYYNSGYDAVVGNGTDAGMTYGNTALGTLNGALNAGLRIVGSAAAIYNLATANVKNGLPSLFDFEKNETVFPK